MKVAATAARIEACDVEEYAALVRPWDVRLNQLSSGDYHNVLQGVSTPGMVIYEERWSRSTEARGASPEGYVMFGTNVTWQGTQVEWCGGVLDDSLIACAPPGADVDFKTPDRNQHVVVLVQPGLLAQAVGQTRVDELLHRRHVVTAGSDGRRLIGTIRGVVREYSGRPGLLGDAFAVRSTESRLLSTLSRCISGGSEDGGSDGIPAQRRLVRRAIELADSRTARVTALELAVAVGVSQRTLETAFRQVLGTTPGSYLRLHRLNSAHRDLAHADPATATVTRIAQSWGFHHPSRFSAAHRRHFGETPSQTLSRPLLRSDTCPLGALVPV